ncbi:MAG: TIGR03960 family B12-binding radical SAM protein [Tissierellales bacterium]|nr:TIGR03960 family B12-binding radical SAM protein [Tissierellales bacterium]
MIKDKVKDILLKVEKPARYIGEEVNVFKKNVKDVDIRYAFAFPDVYDIGMSHMGLHIIYNMLNDMDGVYCERVFTPWSDMEKEMRNANIPLYTLESKTPLIDMDFIGFTLQYEMSYTNILNMLDLAQVAVRSSERKETDPIVMVGGPCAFNPEPLAAIVDVVLIGDSEEVLPELLMIYRKMKREGSFSKKAFYEAIIGLDGIYIPEFYDVEYKEDGTIKEFLPKDAKYPARIKKAMVKNLDEAYFPEKVIVPYVETVHDRTMVEIFRGCTRGCRFCQAGMQYRPVRERNVETIKAKVQKLLQNTGFEELSLSSLSTSDYSCVEILVKDLMVEMKKTNTGISLPSLRLDNFAFDVLEEIQKVRKTGLTFAPEAGSQRLRDAINKGIEEEDLLKTADQAFKMGWSSIKLYFMIGLPTETMDDVMGIRDLAYKVKDLFFAIPREERKGNLRVATSASCFVPKPFTPFQWHGQNTMDEFKEKQRALKSAIRDPKISFSTHDAEVSFLEAIFARGDRRLSEALIKAWEKGCKFDGWADFFDYKLWMETFEELNIDTSFYANRERSYDEVLPWDFIDAGISKEFLIRENEKCKSEELTCDCRKQCHGCGITKTFGSGVCNV